MSAVSTRTVSHLCDPAPTRPVLRYHGGKWKLAPWIIDHLPPHRCYVEPYGGAASVLLRKRRSHSEVYNDLDGGIVGLFRVLQDPAATAELKRLLGVTPFARAEFEKAYEPTDDPIEAARRLIIRSFMGFGSDGHNPEVTTGFRAASPQSGRSPERDWLNYLPALDLIAVRMMGVVVENRTALEVMGQQDGADTCFYLDPPYLPDTRSQKSKRGRLRYHAYVHEMTEDDHHRLLAHALDLEGMVLISGYPSELYDTALNHWERVEREAMACGARPRMEVLWLNPAAASALQSARESHSAGAGLPMFEGDRAGSLP